MSWSIRCGLVACVLFAASLYVYADDYQIWTDSTGKHKIEAKFVRLENNIVLLEGKDGSQSKIPLNKLRQEDQEKALSLAKAKPESESPPDKPSESKATEFSTWRFRNGKSIEARFVRGQVQQIILEKRDGKEIAVDVGQLIQEDQIRAANLIFEELAKRNDLRREKADTSAREKLKEVDKGLSDQPQLSNLDWSNARQIVMAEKPWSAPDITPVAFDWQPKPTLFPAPVNHREHVSQLLISAPSRMVLAVCRINGKRNEDKVTRFIVANAATGKYQRDYLVRGDYQVLAFAPDGKSVVVKQQTIGIHSTELEHWHLTGTGIKRMSRWDFTPKKEDFQSVGSPKAAHFLANGTKALITTDHHFFLLDVEAGKPICYGKMKGKITPAVSQDGKYLFGVHDKKLFALNLTSGEFQGATPVEEKTLLMGGPLAVSPDGKQMAHKITGVIVVYDLQSGQEAFRLPSSPLGKELCWTGSNSIMAGGDFDRLVYFDTVLNYPIWELRHVEHVAFVGKYGMFYAEEDEDCRGLVVSPLPHASAKKVVDQAKKDPNFFIVKPGTRFRVDASSIQDAGLQSQCKAAIEKRIVECGHMVDENARLTIQIELSREEDFDMTYRNRFPNPSNKIEEHKVKIPRWIYYVSILAGNEKLWTKQDYELPPLSVYVTKEDPLSQQISRFSTPNANCFKRMLIPQYDPREAKAGYTVQPLHSSEVSINGIK